jgi:hypothetical protein
MTAQPFELKFLGREVLYKCTGYEVRVTRCREQNASNANYGRVTKIIRDLGDREPCHTTQVQENGPLSASCPPGNLVQAHKVSATSW